MAALITHESSVKRASVPVMRIVDGRACWLQFGTQEYVHEPELERIYMDAQQRIKAPFPYFGGKSRIADQVWARFGAVDNYVEPFFGSGAILFGAPAAEHTETVNDADGLLANFWRATQFDPDAVASFADWPVNEADLHARHRWLVDRRSMVEELMADPEWFDAQAAGWWVWGISQWIGTGWCPPIPAGVSDVRELNRKLPHVGNAGRGIHRASDAHADVRLRMKRPAIGGRNHPSSVGGIHRKELSQQLPSISDGRVGGLNAYAPKLSQKMPFIASPDADRKQHGQGIHGITYANEGALYDYFRVLSARLRRTRVVCGDFARILGPSVTWRHGMTAVFLDPPYADDEHAVTYSGGGKVWERVTSWCEENGAHPQMRIALCGYADTWDAPAGWELIRWRTSGGYGSQGNARGRENANREAIWFSPACLNPADEARDKLSRPIVVRDSDYTGTLFELETNQ